jgi:membrane associated rhomboid family serine protease
VIPFSDPSEPNRIFPLVNIAIILVNFLVFFYELSLGSQGANDLNRFFLNYSLIPCEYTSHCTPTTVAPNPPSPFWITLFTSMFLHGGWAHILGNMIFLWVFGDNVENSMGHIRYLIFYLLCGLGANGLEIYTAQASHTPGLGASGAIAGVLAAYLLMYPSSRIGTLLTIAFIPIPVRLPAWVLIGFWFVLQLFDGLATLSSQATQATGGVAYWAHVGGFITGAVLIWFFRHPQRVDDLRAYHHSGPWGR